MNAYDKPAPMTWTVYIARRRLDPKTLVVAQDITTHDALVAWCEANNVVPPARRETESLFSEQPKVEAKKPRRERVEVPVSPVKGGTSTDETSNV